MANPYISTLAGNGSGGMVDGTGSAARTAWAEGFTIAGGYGYFEDNYSYMRRVNLATGAVTTLIGGGSTCADGTGSSVRIARNGVTLTNDTQYLYWLDPQCSSSNFGRLRRMDLSTDVVSTSPGVDVDDVQVGPGGVVYTDIGNNIYSVNFTTGVQTLVATIPTTEQTRTETMAADSNYLYVLGDSPSPATNLTLTQVDPSTGTSTFVSYISPYNNFMVSAGAYLYILDIWSDVIRFTKSTGATVAIANAGPFADGPAATAGLGSGIAGIDTDGTSLYVADRTYARLREIGDLPVSTLPSGSTGSYPGTGIGSGEAPGGGNGSEKVSCDVGQCTNKPVNTSTGAFWHTFTDMTTPGRGPGLSVTRTYVSSNASQDGLFGYGWSSDYGVNLTQDPSSGGDVTIHQEDGSTIAYSPGSGTAMTPLDSRELATLTHNFDNSYSLLRTDGTKMNFNPAGQLTSISDRNGYATTLTYTSGALSSITDSAGRSYTVTTSGGRVTQITDPGSHSWVYAYNGSGELTSVTDPASAVTTFTYDTNHRLLTMLDPDQQGAGSPVPVTNTYDGSGRVTSQSDFAGRTTTIDYTSISGATKITDPVGNVTVDYYTNGQRTKNTVGYGTAAAADTTYTYDPTTGAVASVTDPLTHAASYTYDSSGNTLTVTDPMSRVTTTTYNSFNEPLAISDPLGNYTNYTYDGNGNLLNTLDQLIVGGALAGNQTTTYTYGDGTHPGDVTAVQDPDGNTTNYTYDSYGDRTVMTAPPTPENATGDKTTYAYDTNTGWLTSTVSPKGNVSGGTPANYTTSYGHDADGRVTYVRDSQWSSGSPSLHETQSSYDADGNVTSTTDANGKTTGYAYDADGELLTTTQPDTTTLTKTWTADGLLHTSTDAASNTTTYTYDPRNDVLTSATPGGKTTTYTYDLAGNLTLQAAPGAVCTGTPTSGCTSFTYDADNEVTAQSYLDGVTQNITSITYDADGRRTGQADATGTSTANYDTLGRLSDSTDGHGTTITYGYDLVGNMTSLVYPGSHTVTRTYDALNRLSTVADWNGKTTTYGYDADSNPLTTTYPSGTSETDTNGYNQLDQLTSVTDKKSATTLAGYTYTRDPAGQLLTSTTTGISEPNQTYTYNSLEHLTASGSAATPTSYAYTAGNDISNRGTTSGGTASTLSYNSDDELCWSTTATISGPTCGSAPTGATTYTYNNSGDRTQSSTPGSTGTNTVAVDAQISKDGTGTGATNTTGTFSTTTAGDILVAFVGSDGANGTAQTETVSGAGLTWTLVKRANSQNGDAEIWKATATGVLTNVTVTETATHSGYHQTLTVVAFKGAAGVGASSNASAATGHPTVNLTTTANGSMVYATGNDWAAATHRTLASGQTLDHEYSDTSQTADYWVQHATSAITTSGTVVTMSDTAPTADRWNLAAVEITPSSTTIPTATTNYAYDEADNLATYTPPTGAATTYKYDSAGLRQSKTTSGTTTYFAWDQADSTPLLLDDGTNYYIYGVNGQSIEQIAVSGGTTTYLHTDQLGSVRLLTNTSGTTVGSKNYDAYGTTTATTGTVTTQLGYTGQYTDSESGLIYLRARYYDPTTAQFLTIDPALATTGQAYEYVGDSPTNAIDPLGLWGWNPISDAEQAGSDVGHAAKAVGTAANAALPAIHDIAGDIAIAASLCAVVTSETIVGGLTCGTIAAAAGAVTAVSSVALYAEGRENGTEAAIDVVSAGLGGLGSLAEAGAGAARGLSEAAEATSALREAETEAAPWYGKAGPWVSGKWWGVKSSLWSATEAGLGGASRALAAGGYALGLYGKSIC